MDNNQYEKYNDQRNKIIKEFKAQKTKNIAIILIVAAVVLALIVAIGFAINNVAIALVLGVIVVIFSVIFLRMRVVTINVSMQKRLQFFEDGYEKY